MITGALDGGWLIGLDEAPYVKHVVGSCDEAGAAAEEKLASAINNGTFSIALFCS